MTIVVKKRFVTSNGKNGKGEKEVSIGDPNFNQGVSDAPLPPGTTLNVNFPPVPPPSQKETFTREEVEKMIAERDDRIGKAREEEKNKLYPQINELNEQVKTLAKEREDRLTAEAEARKQMEDAERLRLESEMSAKDLIAQRDKEFQNQIQELREERDRERILREKETEFAQLQEYKHQRLTQEGDAVADFFHDYVSGNTKEQIDANIERAKTKSAEILASLQERDLQTRRSIPLPPTGAPGGEIPGGTTRTLSNAELASMSMEDYINNRDALRGAASRHVQEKGLYG